MVSSRAHTADSEETTRTQAAELALSRNRLIKIGSTTLTLVLKIVKYRVATKITRATAKMRDQVSFTPRLNVFLIRGDLEVFARPSRRSIQVLFVMN